MRLDTYTTEPIDWLISRCYQSNGPPFPISTAAAAIRLKGKGCADGGHAYKERGTHVDGRRRGRVGRRAYNG
jgi:hypothetical protein